MSDLNSSCAAGQAPSRAEPGPDRSPKHRKFVGRRAPGRPWGRASWIVVLGGLALARLFWAPYQVLGDSMRPTLVGASESGALAGTTAAPADWVVVSRSAYWFHRVTRWDVVVVSHDSVPGAVAHESVKRVVALPGEAVALRNGQVWVDGIALRPPVALEEMYVVAKGPFGHQPQNLGPDEYFVLGDNSYPSRDSREWGPVSGRQLGGRVAFVLWPPTRRGWVR